MTLTLPPTELVLEENYWKHFEMFCMHLDSLPPKALDDLIAIHIHGRGDQATSSTSTSYWTPEVTAVHLDILMRCRGAYDSVHAAHLS